MAEATPWSEIERRAAHPLLTELSWSLRIELYSALARIQRLDEEIGEACYLETLRVLERRCGGRPATLRMEDHRHEQRPTGGDDDGERQAHAA